MTSSGGGDGENRYHSWDFPSLGLAESRLVRSLERGLFIGKIVLRKKKEEKKKEKIEEEEEDTAAAAVDDNLTHLTGITGSICSAPKSLSPLGIYRRKKGRGGNLRDFHLLFFLLFLLFHQTLDYFHWNMDRSIYSLVGIIVVDG